MPRATIRPLPMDGIDSISQIYETTLLDEATGISGHFLVVPTDCFGQTIDLQTVLDLLGSGVVTSSGAMSPEDLPVAIQICLNEAASPEGQRPVPKRPEVLHASEFAYYLSYAPVVPFRRSLLEENALAKLLAAAGPGAGIVLGFSAAAHNPLLLAWVPAGMIIFAAAKGASRAIEERTYHLIADHAARTKSRNRETKKGEKAANKETLGTTTDR